MASYCLPPGAGRTVNVLGTHARVLAAGQHTADAVAVVEWMLPSGTRLPGGIHTRETLGLYVLEGEVHIASGGGRWTAASGAFVHLEPNVPQSLEVVGAGAARLIVLAWPAGLEELLSELHVLERAAERTCFQATAARYGVQSEPAAGSGTAIA
jgi:quercetin dioxygenase-like cupin family protein